MTPAQLDTLLTTHERMTADPGARKQPGAGGDLLALAGRR